MSLLPDPLDHRQAEFPIEPLLLARWSPRAMSAQPVDQQVLQSLFEAARWAPSSYNEQEWKFLFAHRESPNWKLFFDLLVEGNQAWCQRAGVLVVVLSAKNFARNGKPNSSHTLDAGMAVQNFLLQAAAMGLVAHPMVGFNRSQARALLEVPEDHEVEVMLAVGHPGDPALLPEAVRGMDSQPSGRRPQLEFVKEGKFRFS
ncbi:MAG: nitroreductase family protein [Planctomycetaceae bacterium]